MHHLIKVLQLIGTDYLYFLDILSLMKSKPILTIPNHTVTYRKREFIFSYLKKSQHVKGGPKIAFIKSEIKYVH